jgi:excisionase family DNA binding protein
MNTFNELPSESLTPDQAAELLQVKTSTVYAWISRGELQANRTGYSRSVTKEQLRRFISNRKSGAYAFALEHIR